MEEMEIRSLLKSLGWTMHKRKRTSGMYIYAAKRGAQGLEEVYLMPETKLAQATRESILSKLNKK